MADRNTLWRRHLKTVLVWAGVLIVIVVAVFWLSGGFIPKTAPGHEQVRAWPINGPLASVELQTYQRVAPTVGTVRAIQQVQVASQLTAEVTELNVRAGDSVEAGQILARLDDTALQARAARTKAQLVATEARLRQAQSDLKRVTDIYERNAATEREFDDAVRAAEVAEADAEASRQADNEARTQLAYATVESPMSGKVIDKHVEVGDLVQPGQIILTLEGQLQLEAEVPESLSVKLSVGDAVDVQIDAVDLRCTGNIREIVPQAAATSRTFLVKVGGPCPPNVHSGMFGRLFIPLGEAQRLTIPTSAVREVGQLKIVYVADTEAKQAHRRFVRLGEKLGDRVEVLSGLEQGEQILAQPPDEGSQP